MVEAGKAMMDSFKPSTVFLFSDEITLLFPIYDAKYGNISDVDPKFIDFEVQQGRIGFSGRIQKIASVASGFASVNFFRALSSILENEKVLFCLFLIKIYILYFDMVNSNGF
jgi:tRNA(His) 5'-end guanylyltransferase